MSLNYIRPADSLKKLYNCLGNISISNCYRWLFNAPDLPKFAYTPPIRSPMNRITRVQLLTFQELYMFFKNKWIFLSAVCHKNKNKNEQPKTSCWIIKEPDNNNTENFDETFFFIYWYF